jgi:hypothetical protein
VIGASPVRLSATDVFVRGLIIESASGNVGEIYVADSETKATSSNRHILYYEGDAMTIDSSMYADLNGELNLKDVWVHGNTPGDRVVVSYVEIIGALC